MNLISQLSMLQLGGFAKLWNEQRVDCCTMSTFGEVIISLNVAMSLLFNVDQTADGSFTVKYGADKEFLLTYLYELHMKVLKRKASYTRFRKPYLESLTRCPALMVTRTDCSLCKAEQFYCYCPHILAVRFASIDKGLFGEVSIVGIPHLRNYVRDILSKMDFTSFVSLVGCHSSLYYGFLNGNDVIPTDGTIYDAIAINRWVAQASSFLERMDNSLTTIRSMHALTGRRRNFLEMNGPMKLINR